jgi:cytochrome oxidase Cu insertion factor (SCO1/SenC/PrrC family)
VTLLSIGGACKTFTPLLSVLHEEAQDEDGKEFQVVYVSSDDTKEHCHKYMDQKHGDWLRIPFDDTSLRQGLKQRYGVFAGKEQGLFPKEVQRRSGIPTLVVISPTGDEHVLLDCENPKVLKEIEHKGTKFLDQWDAYKW